LIKSITGIDNEAEAYKKLMNVNDTSLLSNIEDDRLNRYREYDSIEAKIPYIKRALNVMTQNILSPDDYNLDYFNIDSKDQSDELNPAIISNIKDIIDEYEIQDHAKDIVYNTLKYGDYFAEIVSVDDVLQNNRILLKENYNVKNENSDIKVNLIFESDDKANSNSNKKSQVFVNYLNPYNVVRLGDKYPMGYLVFPNNMIVKNPQQITNLNSTQPIAKKIIDKVRSMSSSQRAELFKTEEDLKKVLAKLIYYSDNNELSIKVKYVAPDKMVHFTVNRNKFYPYGTSMLFGTEFLARILIAIQGSIMIQRLTRVIDRRMFKVEIGPSRDAATYIEAFKEKMERRKFTIDSIGSIDSLPSQLASFEDLYLPMKSGKSYVEYDAIPPQGELSSRIDDLKSIRDEIVASMEVPAAYLGIEENIESKNTLAQQNIVFASSIVYYQKEFSRKFTELVKAISRLSNSNSNEIDKCSIKLNPPMSLITEKNSDYYQSLSNIVSSLTSLGIPKEYIMKKYLKSFNWSEIERMKADEKMMEVIMGKSENSEKL
jgi:hypothetical protein